MCRKSLSRLGGEKRFEGSGTLSVIDVRALKTRLSRPVNRICKKEAEHLTEVCACDKPLTHGP